MACQLVSSGWYSSSAKNEYTTHGSDFQRGKNFRSLWWKSLEEFVHPEIMFLVDSKSPVKPEDEIYRPTGLVHIELMRNPGHSQNCEGHYSGWMASAILGMEYALHSGVDYVLYVEQDALIYGGNFIKNIETALLNKDFVFGGDFEHIEQSVFAISRKGLRGFLNHLHAIEYTDRQISPEMKFMYAASSLKRSGLLGLTSWDLPGFFRRPSTKILKHLMGIFSNYDVLNFGYGRKRPINFSDDVFYFQHGSDSEILDYRKKTGFF